MIYITMNYPYSFVLVCKRVILPNQWLNGWYTDPHCVVKQFFSVSPFSGSSFLANTLVPATDVSTVSIVAVPCVALTFNHTSSRDRKRSENRKYHVSKVKIRSRGVRDLITSTIDMPWPWGSKKTEFIQLFVQLQAGVANLFHVLGQKPSIKRSQIAQISQINFKVSSWQPLLYMVHQDPTTITTFRLN